MYHYQKKSRTQVQFRLRSEHIRRPTINPLSVAEEELKIPANQTGAYASLSATKASAGCREVHIVHSKRVPAYASPAAAEASAFTKTNNRKHRAEPCFPLSVLVNADAFAEAGDA